MERHRVEYQCLFWWESCLEILAGVYEQLLQLKPPKTCNCAGFESKNLICCVFFMQENQILERRIRCERLTAKTLVLVEGRDSENVGW